MNMNMNPGTTIVQRGGFLTALVRGVFGLLTAAVVCSAGVGLYALHIVDKKGDRLLNCVETVGRNLPDVQAALPPVLGDVLADRREPEYREKLEISAHTKVDRDGEHARAIIEVKNNGDQTVSLLALRVVVKDADGDPAYDCTAYAATPLALEDDDWRGPLPPGATRTVVERIGRVRSAASASVEVSDLRVWDGKMADDLRNDLRQRRAAEAKGVAAAESESETRSVSARGDSDPRATATDARVSVTRSSDGKRESSAERRGRDRKSSDARGDAGREEVSTNRDSQDDDE